MASTYRCQYLAVLDMSILRDWRPVDDAYERCGLKHQNRLKIAHPNRISEFGRFNP